MPGFTLDARQTSRLADIFAACTVKSENALPPEVMGQIQELLHADSVSFRGFDTLLPHIWFEECLETSGAIERGAETPTEALSNPFWHSYWEGACSYPDRSGDFDSVTTVSDFYSLADWRARVAAMGDDEPMDRHITAHLPGRTPGQHLRLACWRQRGTDFTERDRFFLTLLRPHLEKAFWRGMMAQQQPPRLTRRQLQILRMVQAGLTNLQIAHRMTLSEGTVRSHLNNIYARLDVRNRTAAVHKVFGVSDCWP